MHSETISELTAYYHLFKKLESLGGPAEDGDLFEEVLGLEEGMLEKFGLPLSNKNKEILWSLTSKPEPTEQHLQQTLAQLQAAAEKHLSAPVLTDLEQLLIGEKEDLPFFDVLPEMGHPTHDYTIFLYEHMLYLVSPEKVLEELNALKRLDCYGDTAILKNKHPFSFRRTKIYKQLKPYLSFLDEYLTHDDSDPFIYDLEEEDEESRAEPDTTWDQDPFDLFSPPPPPEPVDFTPSHELLTDVVEVEEIVFGDDSAVTVIGLLHTPDRPQQLTLGFDFDELTNLLRSYGEQGQHVLLHFNKNRQRNAVECPVVLDLENKTGSTLAFHKHYLKVYKPMALGPDGKHQLMQEAFYIVEEIIDKNGYNQQQAQQLKSQLEGTFHHLRHHYAFYLDDKQKGLNEYEARAKHDLLDKVRFDIARLLYELWACTGRFEMK